MEIPDDPPQLRQINPAVTAAVDNMHPRAAA
jgi:hypothetical protein